VFYRASASSLGSQKSSGDLEETGVALIAPAGDPDQPYLRHQQRGPVDPPCRRHRVGEFARLVRAKLNTFITI
jgi:hypothetical protein